ncbi:MAG: peptidyl-prolyl cis-trans isomerase [Halioglobus sp.]|nr:peptidyl-prolyl cis-trans isomerase [Halioglobus sp.]
MTLLARLNRPWLHFIVLGSVLYHLQGLFFPAPKPVVGPLGEARLEALQQQWYNSTGRLPTPAQQQRMVAAELDRDMLFARAVELQLHRYDTVVYQRLLRNMRFLQLGEGESDRELFEQALQMRLHLGDEVVKRRLIQIMEQLLLAANPPAAPTEAEIAAAFEQRREELRRPPRYSIEHLYFNREREPQIGAAIAAITERGLSASQARDLGSPFLPGYRFTRQSPQQLARHFGGEFVAHLEAANPQPASWVGPLRSTYGLHYVWVSAVEPARDATLEEVRAQLVRDLESRARDRALREGIAAMRDDYEIRS